MLRRGLLRREAPILPSLYDRYPAATTALRRPRGLRVVPIERIVGTARHPSQNTADFLPLPHLRGRNWRERWNRIRKANDQLSVLPAVELLQVGDDYYVADGHNRVAAARRAGAVAVDGDVTELVVPGVEPGATQARTTAMRPPCWPARTSCGRLPRAGSRVPPSIGPSVDELRREALTGESETVEDGE